jgi:nucleoside-diphosphate kinase
MVKPDGVKKNLFNEVVGRMSICNATDEHGHFLLVGRVRIIEHPTREQMEAHYAPHRGKPFFEDLINFMISGPVAVFVVAGVDATNSARKMAMMIREEYANPHVKRENVVHASENEAEALREIDVWYGIIPGLGHLIDYGNEARRLGKK